MIDNIKNNYDWQEAFKYGQNIRVAYDCSPDPFTIEDVATVLNYSEGQNDGESWIMMGRLRDGRFFFLDAWCDYTGWG